MQFRHLFKFNENHDTATGQFSTADGSSAPSAGSPEDHGARVTGTNPFKDVDIGGTGQFNDAAKKLREEQGVKDWQKDDSLWLNLHSAYFGNNYGKLNTLLRGGLGPFGTPSHEQTNEINLISNSIESHGVTLPVGTEVYRGLGGSFAEALDKMQPGDSYEDKAFVSTSPRQDVADMFTGVVPEEHALLHITTTAAMKALLRNSGESEVLFDKGRKFTLRAKRVHNKITYYDVDMS